MNEIITALIGSGSVLALSSGAWLGWKLSQYRAPEVAAEDVQPVSMEKYAVLERLASHDDVEYLRTLPGFSAAAEKKFLQERRAAFRGYLREMASDFNRIHSAARRLVSVAPETHADLVGVLFRQQITFWRALAVIEMRLATQWFGVPTIDLSELMGSFEAMRTASLAGSAA